MNVLFDHRIIFGHDGAMRPELLDKARLFDGADVTLMRRDDRWWMIMGELADPAVPRIDLRTAHLPRGAAVDSLEWTVDGRCAAPTPSNSWDATGYHCVSYVRGRSGGQWVERLYYASSAAWTDITGPYSIGFLEWDGSGTPKARTASPAGPAGGSSPPTASSTPLLPSPVRLSTW
jgi:hypothetical protein